MKTLLNVFILILIGLLFSQCADDEPEPMITPPPDPNNPDTAVPIGGGVNNLYAVGDTVSLTDNGYILKGALFGESDDTRYEIASGEIEITLNDKGEITFFEGTGNFEFPDYCFFKSLLPKVVDFVPEGIFTYKTGKEYKESGDKFKDLPLEDDTYYVYYTFTNLLENTFQEYEFENSNIGVSNYFLDMSAPSILIVGGYFEAATPAGPIKLGDRLAIGISCKNTFPFTPRTYDDDSLNAVIDEAGGFKELSGYFYLEGEFSIPGLKEYIPLGVNGQMVLENTVLESDPLSFFRDGFSASFNMGTTGELVLTHDILDILPLDWEVTYGSTTFQMFQKATVGQLPESTFRFAGQFDGDEHFEAILGPEIAKHILSSGSSGSVFYNFGSEVPDWEIYFTGSYDMNVPGLGKQNLRNAAFRANKDFVQLSSGIGLPFGLSEVKASGKFQRNGDFLLTGKMNALNDNFPKIQGVDIGGDVLVSFSNTGVDLKGTMNLPFGIGDGDVTGAITKQGLNLNGMVNSQLDLGNGLEFPIANVKFSTLINGKSPGIINLSGGVKLNPTISDDFIAFQGTIQSFGLILRGHFDTNLTFNNVTVPAIDMSFTISNTGVQFRGGLDVPFGLGMVDVTGSTLRQKDNSGFPAIQLGGNFKSNPTLDIKGINLPTSNLSLTASTLAGVKLNGDLRLPLGLGDVMTNFTGGLRTKGIWFNGTLQGRIMEQSGAVADLLIRCVPEEEPSITIAGTIRAPFGLPFEVTGYVFSNIYFIIDGYFKYQVSDKGASFNATINAKFTPHPTSLRTGINGSITGSACWKGKCATSGLGLKMKWGSNPVFSVCYDYPGAGDICLP